MTQTTNKEKIEEIKEKLRRARSAARDEAELLRIYDIAIDEAHSLGIQLGKEEAVNLLVNERANLYKIARNAPRASASSAMEKIEVVDKLLSNLSTPKEPLGDNEK